MQRFEVVGTTNGMQVFKCSSWLGRLLGSTYTEGTVSNSINLWARWCEEHMKFTNPVYAFTFRGDLKLGFVFKRYGPVALFHQADLSPQWWFIWKASPDRDYPYEVAHIKVLRNWVLFVGRAVCWQLFFWPCLPICRWYRRGL